MQKILIASDHAGFDRKSEVSEFLSGLGFEVIDLGTDSNERCNYPEYAAKLARSVGKDKGILICGSGIGVDMVANKFQGIRSARILSVEDAKLSRQHNNSNVICLSSRMTSLELTKQMIDIWLKTDFEGGRHETRVSMIDELGQKI